MMQESKNQTKEFFSFGQFSKFYLYLLFSEVLFQENCKKENYNFNAMQRTWSLQILLSK